MQRVEVYDESGRCIEWAGLDAFDFVRVVNGEEVERRPATAVELAAGQPPAVPTGELAVDRYTVPADATSYAVARYGATDRVLFVVNGVVHPVEPVGGVAELSIAADAPGVITVAVRDRQFVIVAEGV